MNCSVLTSLYRQWWFRLGKSQSSCRIGLMNDGEGILGLRRINLPITRPTGKVDLEKRLSNSENCILTSSQPAYYYSSQFTTNIRPCTRNYRTLVIPTNFMTNESGSSLQHRVSSFDLLKPNDSKFGLGSFIYRGKKSRKNERKEKYEESSDDDDDDDDDDDWELSRGEDFKDTKVKVISTRLDAILKAGFNISRNKADGVFYSSKVRINEQKVLKKNAEVDEGDEIDVIKDDLPSNPNMLNISRVIVMKVGDYDSSDKRSVLLRRFPNLLIRKYSDYKRPDDEEDS